MITCDVIGQAKYILGPVELDGNDISDATNGQEQNTGQWAVNLVFNDQGTQKFAEVSQRLYGAQARSTSSPSSSTAACCPRRR